MTPADVERVFGASGLKMVTGRHVEVFREVARSGEERRYTKRFLATPEVDFRPWTEREWRVLVRLGRLPGAPVAKALDLLPADEHGPARLQTRDAGATVDQWATLVPLRRGETTLRNLFEDCANWWQLARQCMVALDALHALGFVHLDLKPDNICIPWAPAGAGRPLPGQPLAPRMKALALIDVAFSLVPEVDLPGPLPLLKQPAYEYQSPRLLHALEEGRRGSLAATRALDWRCDFFSLAAMLWRYLPEVDDAPGSGWTTERHRQAEEFVHQLLDFHGAPLPTHWPHRQLISLAGLRLHERDLAAALREGCTFDPDRDMPLDAEPVPPTRIADTVVRKVAPEPRDEEADRIASAPSPLGEARPPAAPIASAPVPLGDQRIEPRVSAPTPLEADARREPTISALAPLAESRREPIISASAALAESRREPTLSAPAETRREPSISAPAPLGESRPPPRAAAPAPLDQTRPLPRTSAPAPLDQTRPPPRASAPAPLDQTRPPPRASAPAPLDESWPRPRTSSPAPLDESRLARASSPAPLAEAPAEPSAPADTAPMSWPAPEADADADAAEASAREAVAPILPRRRRRVIAAVAALAAIAATLAAWWFTVAQPSLTVSTIPLPQRDAALPSDSPAPPAHAAASTAPTIVAAAPAPAVVPAPPPAPIAASAAATAAPIASPLPSESTAPPETSASAAAAPPIDIAASAPPPPAGTVDVTPPEPDLPASGELAAIADELMRSRIPRAAQAAERQLSRVLAVAAGASELRRRSNVRAAIQALRSAAPRPAFAAPVRGDEARKLNEAALVAYWRREDVDQALRLQTRAFGANPFDSEIVGNLAFLRLKQSPPDAEAARQLALYSLTLNDPRFPSGRIEDWTAFAIASALSGHDVDARNAWFASMALASDLQHQCNNAVRAEAIYGERLRPSVQAMLQRARSSAAYGRCEAALAPKASSASRQGGTATKAAAAPRGQARTATRGSAKATTRARRAIP